MYLCRALISVIKERRSDRSAVENGFNRYRNGGSGGVDWNFVSRLREANRNPAKQVCAVLPTFVHRTFHALLVLIPGATLVRGAVARRLNLPMNAKIGALLLLVSGLMVQTPLIAAQSSDEAGAVLSASTADGTKTLNNGGPALTGARHPLYRLRESDVVDIKFTFSPEFDQTVTILPDGFITLKSAGDIYAEGMTLVELRDAVRSAYASTLHDPDISVVLSSFEHPFFVVGGQVGHPGKFELRSPTSVTEAVAVAGGFTEQAKHSEVVLFRKISEGVVESHVLDLKHMLASRNLEEDIELKPGDMLFVPQNRISKIRKFLPVASLSTFFTPAQF